MLAVGEFSFRPDIILMFAFGEFAFRVFGPDIIIKADLSSLWSGAEYSDELCRKSTKRHRNCAHFPNS